MIAKQKRSRLVPVKNPVRASSSEKKETQIQEKASHNNLKKRCRHQSNELKIKNGQLRQGANREKAADIKIEEQREELLHVTRVGKLAEFVSSLAHEISQPLTAILSYSQAAQRMFAGREPQLQEILQFIINDTHRATEVIRRLRLLLKKSKPAFEPLDINILINDTVTLIMSHIIVRNKTIKFELDGNLPLIRGDRIQLQQVFLNLISNSLEAMDGDSNSREMRITTSRQDSNMVLVEVKDSGCGIPVENMGKLFAHFFTNKPDGLGMGLSISRSIIEAHGGRVEARNNPDRGATFYFTIPVNIKTADEE